MLESMIEDFGLEFCIFVAFRKIPESIIVDTTLGSLTISWIWLVHIKEAIPPADTPAIMI